MMISAAIIAVAVCIAVVYVAYLVQSSRVYEREEKRKEEIEAQRKTLEVELDNAKQSHNLARIALVRSKLRSLSSSEK